jgi:nicotinamidase-related amidase
LLLVDPYNDFLSEGGKLWPLVAEVAEAVGLHRNLAAITATFRSSGRSLFVVPHHRAEPDDLAGWDHPSPYQVDSARAQVFARGSWGGDWHPDFAPQPGDVIVKEHWGSSGFANTDLDFLLKQKGVSHLVTSRSSICPTASATSSTRALTPIRSGTPRPSGTPGSSRPSSSWSWRTAS